MLLLLVAVAVAGNFLFNPRLASAGHSVRERAQAMRYQVRLADLVGLEPLLWVDARSSAVFEEGHATGAVNLSPERFDDQLEDFFLLWHPDYTVVVYCDGAQCRASEEVAIRLRRALGENGERVYVLAGGWQEYLQGAVNRTAH